MTLNMAQNRVLSNGTGVDPLVRLERSRLRGAGALLALVAFALLPTLFAPFFADDYLHIEVAARLRDALARGWVLPIDSAGAWWTPRGLSIEYFRPMVVLSFAADRLLYGEHAWGYHLTNLALHMSGTLLVWGVARRVLGAGFAAWGAAALFAIHPCHTVAVGWISGRTDVLAGVLYLAAFLAYLETRSSSANTTPRPWLTALSLLLFVLALLSKEMAATFPAVLLGDALLRPRGERLARRLVAPGLAAVAGAIYFAMRTRMFGGFHPPPTPFAFHPGDPGLAMHLLTAPLLYLGDFVWFVPADPMATEPFWRTHPALFVLFVGVVLAPLWNTIRRASDRRMAVWGLGWIAITILPVMMLTVGEHFLYLPSVGYCLLVGAQLPADPTRIDARERRSLAIVGALVAVVCIVRTAMFTNLSFGSTKAIDEATAALDRAPEARLLLVEDLPVAAALAFPHAVRLARPQRPVDVQILSLVPRVMPDAEDLTVMTFPAPGHLKLSRSAGFLGSYLERALQGPPVAFRAGERFERAGYAVTIVDAPGGRIHEFEVQISDPARTLVMGRGEQGLKVFAP